LGPHLRQLLRAVAGLGVAAAVVGCGSDDTPGTSSPQSATPVATVRLTESEFKIDPAQLQVTKSGVVEFQVQNGGKVTHALEVEGKGARKQTGDIPAGASASIQVELDPGSYELYCPLGSHRRKGMSASVNVGLSRGSGGESEAEREREGASD
jgi:plastocyanin